MFGSKGNDTDDDMTPVREDMIRGHGLEERRATAWIGGSVVIKGDVTSSEDMTIAGRVEGDVRVAKNTLVVAPGARIHGDIVARNIVVLGEVSGTITADGRAEIGESGSVVGDIRTPKLVIAEGAALNGRLKVAAP